MTVSEFDALSSSPRRGAPVAGHAADENAMLGEPVSPALTEFRASIADVTNDQHENMAGLVQPSDFNAEVVVRFLRQHGIEAHCDEHGGFRYKALDSERASDVNFACVCLRASISYAIEAAFWCSKAKR